MTTATSTSDLHADHERYEDFLASLRARFAALATPGAPLFTTDAEGLFSAFLGALPLERRQHYNCRSCRRFVTEYGGLVTIEPNGDMAPAMWDPLNAPPFFEPAVRAVRHIVNRAKVTGVFLSSDETLGLASNQDPGRPVAREDLPAKPPGEWFHMAVARPKALCFKHPTLTAGQVMAEKREEHGMLCRGLAEFSVDVVRQAHTLLSNGQLYRSEKCIDAAKWLLDLHEARRATKNRAICDNVTWRAVATAPAGYCHVRTTMIGTLLEDIAAELGFANIKRRFDEKMSPTAYQRPTAAPTSGAIAEAEKVISKLAAAGSLERRFARLDEIEAIWMPKVAKAEAAPSGGVFAHLKPKAPAASQIDVPAVVMTWEKFARTVLPDAVSIEVQVPSSPDRFMALVTAAQSDTPPILQWDSAEARNPVSWYYASGIDAEIKRRVVQAGGVHENCDIRASLLWNNRNDLDLHVLTPNGEHIMFNNKRSSCGGWLDVDMNVRGETTTPIENIRWMRGMARAGHYMVFVQNYSFHERTHGPTPFRVELEVNGEVFQFDGSISPRYQTGPSSDVTVAEFIYHPGQRLAAPPRGMQTAQAGGPDAWGVTPGQWAKVTGIAESPNLWGSTPMKQHGQHMFFLLDGCKDTAQGVGRGFFVEMMKSEFRPIRSTLEAHMATATIAGAEEASACGLGMSDQAPWNLVLRVRTGNATSTYKIDRRD